MGTDKIVTNLLLTGAQNDLHEGDEVYLCTFEAIVTKAEYQRFLAASKLHEITVELRE